MVQRIIDIKTDGIAAFDRQSRRLVLTIEYESITVAMVDKETNNWMAAEVLQCTEEDLVNMVLYMDELKHVSTLLNYTGLDTHIYVRTPDALPMPNFLQYSAEELVTLQYGLLPGETAETCKVDAKMDVAFKIKGKWLHAFKELFAAAEVSSTLALLIKQALASNEKFPKAIMQLVFSKGLAEITIAQHNRLLLAKCFRFNTADDLLYNLLNICKQLEIDPSEILIKVQGLIDEQSPLYDSLSKYFKDLQFENADSLALGMPFKSIPAHYFTGLINAS